MLFFGPPNIDKLESNHDGKGLIRALGYPRAWEVRRDAAAALGRLAEPTAVQALIAACHDKDKDVCRAAAEALGEIRDQMATNPLIQLLTNAEPPIVFAAIRSLGEIGDPRAAEPLTVLLRHADHRIRLSASDALGKNHWEPVDADGEAWFAMGKQAWDACIALGTPAIPPLRCALQDADNEIRQSVAQKIGSNGAPFTYFLLIDALHDSYYRVRETAIEAIAQIGSPMLAPVLAAIEDPEWRVREAAVATLGRIGNVRAIPPLTAALRDNDKDVRRAAAEALDRFEDLGAVQDAGADYWIAKQNWETCAEIGLDAVLPLIAILSDKDQEIRHRAALALGKIGDRGAALSLVSALRDSASYVREAVAEALGDLEDPSAVEPLIGVLRDDTWSARRAAVKALGAIGDDRAVPSLIEALRDEDKFVRESAAVALGRLDNIHAVEPLIACLKDKDKDVRRAVAQSLGEMVDSRAVEPLIAALTEDEWDVREAVLMKRKFKDTRSFSEYVDEQKEKYVYIREAAAEALSKIGDPRAIPPLIAALKNISKNVRIAAADALGKIGDPRAVDALLDALHDHQPAVQQAAGEALSKIGKPAVETLIQELLEPASRIQEPVMEALGKIGDPRGIEPLIPMLVHKNPPLRETAAIALTRIGLPSIGPLVETLTFDDQELRMAACAVLERMDWKPAEDEAGAFYWIVKNQWERCVGIGEPAIAPLIAALRFKRVDDPEEWRMRKAPVDALSKIGIPAIPSLIMTLEDDNTDVCRAAVNALSKIGKPALEPVMEALGSESFGVCRAAVEVLGKLRDARAVEPLIASLETSHWYLIRKAAAESLGKIGDARAASALVETLKDDYFKVREAASEALVQIGKPAFETLLGALHYREWRVRRSTAKILGRIGDARAVEPLIAVLADDDRDVRETAAWSLVSLSYSASLEDEVKKRILSVLS
jgi:HEAT repeat protein